jgi:hypothetical protein
VSMFESVYFLKYAKNAVSGPELSIKVTYAGYL